MRLTAAQSTAIKLRHQVSEQRHAVEQAEMEAATMASISEQRSKSQAAFPSSNESFGYQQSHHQSSRNEVNHDDGSDWGSKPSEQHHYDDGYAKNANHVDNVATANPNMTGWGMGIGKPTTASNTYSGIPSPTNSLNGDANPFNF